MALSQFIQRFTPRNETINHSRAGLNIKMAALQKSLPLHCSVECTCVSVAQNTHNSPLLLVNSDYMLDIWITSRYTLNVVVQIEIVAEIVYLSFCHDCGFMWTLTLNLSHKLTHMHTNTHTHTHTHTQIHIYICTWTHTLKNQINQSNNNKMHHTYCKHTTIGSSCRQRLGCLSICS